MINNISSNNQDFTSFTIIDTVQAKIPVQAENSGSNSPTSLQEAMSLLAGMLNNVQATSGQALADQANQAAQVSAALVKQLQANVVKIQQEVQKEQDEEAKDKTRHKILEAFEGVAGGILMLCGCEGTGAMLMTMSVLQLTGISSDVTTGLNKAFVDMGMSSDAAKLVTQCLIFAVTAAATFGMSAGAETSNVAKIFKAIAAIGVGLTTANSLASDSAVVYFDNNSHGKSKEQQEQAEQIAQLIQTLVGALLALGGGVAAGAVETPGASTKTYAGKFSDLFNDQRGQLWMQRVQAGNSILSGLSNAATDIEKAQRITAIASLEAENLVTESALSRNTRQTSNDINSLQTIIANQGQQMSNVINAIQAEFVNSSPA